MSHTGVPKPPETRFGSNLPAIIAGLLVVAGVAIGIWFWMNRPAAVIARGNREFVRREFAAALKTLAPIVDQPNPDVEALWLAGEAARELGRTDDALRYYTQIPPGKTGAQALGQLAAAELCMKRGEFRLAEGFYRNAFSAGVVSVNAIRQLAELLDATGRRFESARLRRWLVQNKYFQVFDLVMLAKVDEAYDDRALLSKSVQADLDWAPRLLGWGRGRMYQDGPAASLPDLLAAVQADPKLIEAHVQLGLALADTQRFDELPGWSAALPVDAEMHAGTWLVRGLWMNQLQNPAAARCFWESLQRDPDGVRATVQLGQLLRTAGHADDARRLLERGDRLTRLHVASKRVFREGNNLEQMRIAAEQTRTLGRTLEAWAWMLAIQSVDSTASDLNQPIAELAATLPPPGDQIPLDEQVPIGAAGESAKLSSSEATLIELAAETNSELAAANLPEWSSFSTLAGLVTHSKSTDGSTASGSTSITTSPDKNVPSVTPADPAALPVELAARHLKIDLPDVANEAGLIYSFDNGKPRDVDGMMIHQTIGAAVGGIDFDLDGWTDVYFPQAGGPPLVENPNGPIDRLFRNVGGKRFVDNTTESTIVERGCSQALAVGDINNDGFPDLYIANIGANRLFENLGDGTFREVTAVAGFTGFNRRVWTSAAAIVDLNNDSNPEIVDVNYLAGSDLYTRMCTENGITRTCAPFLFPGEQDDIWQSAGDGTFTRVTETSGINGLPGRGLGLIAADFDGSGRLSLFIANDVMENYFYRNESPAKGSSVTMVNDAIATGLAYDADGTVQACMGIACDDLDGDGVFDLFVTNFLNESNTFYRQVSPGQFSDIARSTGLREPSVSMLTFGAQTIDVQRDGRPDLFVINGHIDDYTHKNLPFKMPSQLFFNLGEGNFAEWPAKAIGPAVARLQLGRGLARLDWNRDLSDDLIAVSLDQPAQLLENRTTPRGHAITVQLRGITGHRDAIGATVTVRTADATYTKPLVAGEGFAASNERQLTFGLGAAENVVDVSVKWLGKDVSDVYAVSDVDQRYLLIEGRRNAETLPN